MLEIVHITFMILCKIFAVYFAIISVFALLGKKEVKKENKQLKFAAIIAARNEESCIAGIIESLQKQNYPKELIDVIVVPNNCTDNTEEVAKKAGATVLTAPKSVNSKGGALNFTMEKLLKSKENYDAFIVFDADNEASSQFVTAMNKILCSGARVAKSRILAKNRNDSWVASCYDIHFCTANLLLNRARARLGLSARLIGTGFAVRCDYLQELGGFNTKTITEDAEFFATCASRGEKIAFCEDAITYDEEPLDFRTSLIQRKRWVSGIMQVVSLKMPDLIKGLATHSSAKFSFDAIMQLSFAYVQACIPFAFIISMINSSVNILAYFSATIMVSYLGFFVNAIVVLTIEKRLSFSKNILLGILMYPIFVLSFILLQTASLFKKTVAWKEIKHTGVRINHTQILATQKTICDEQLVSSL